MDTDKKNLLPRERFLLYGPSSLSEEELLAILLGSGTKNKNVFEISKELFSLIKETKCNITLLELKKIRGIGTQKALCILASLELSKRLESLRYSNISYNNPFEIFQFYRKKFMEYETEHLLALYFDSKLHLIYEKEITIGSIRETMICPSELLKYAIKISASSFIILHNHPSNDTTPSKSDIESTERVKEASQLLGIFLLDHIIIGKTNYYSFSEHQNL